MLEPGGGCAGAVERVSLSGREICAKTQRGSGTANVWVET